MLQVFWATLLSMIKTRHDANDPCDPNIENEDDEMMKKVLYHEGVKCISVHHSMK